jgi:hypothetical protein
MDAQDLNDFIQLEKRQHHNDEAPTFDKIYTARAWAKTTKLSPYEALDWRQYKCAIPAKGGKLADMLNDKGVDIHEDIVLKWKRL